MCNIFLSNGSVNRCFIQMTYNKQNSMLSTLIDNKVRVNKIIKKQASQVGAISTPYCLAKHLERNQLK